MLPKFPQLPTLKLTVRPWKIGLSKRKNRSNDPFIRYSEVTIRLWKGHVNSPSQKAHKESSPSKRKNLVKVNVGIVRILTPQRWLICNWKKTCRRRDEQLLSAQPRYGSQPSSGPMLGSVEEFPIGWRYVSFHVFWEKMRFVSGKSWFFEGMICWHLIDVKNTVYICKYTCCLKMYPGNWTWWFGQGWTW